MKQKKWIAAICVSIVILAAFIFVISKYKDRNYIVEKYPEVSNLLSFVEQSKNDTVVVSNFNDLYRRLFLSKINDSIISFCRIDNDGVDYMIIVSPDSISVFESPDFTSNFTMHTLVFDNDQYTNNIAPIMVKRIEAKLDLIFRQEQVRFYRFIGFIKEKPNRVIFVDNFYNFFSMGAFCHTITVKNNMFNPQKWKFINDKQKVTGCKWRMQFVNNMVPNDSILPRIRRVETCKDSIERWLIEVE